MNKIIIAIDGYSSTGKSTFAKAIASALDYLYLDSGAFYRAITWFAIENGWVDPGGTPNVAAIENNLHNISISFRKTPENGSPMTFLNGKNVEEAIRSLQVSQSVSAVSVLPCVRDFVDRQLRKWGENKGIVMDGRDIGTAVFPQAELKIFMTAPVEIRARRRLNEILAKGQNATFEEVLDNVEQRDYLDSHRSKNPLSRADDAIVLDNGNMTIPQQMEWFMKLFEEKWGTRPQ